MKNSSGDNGAVTQALSDGSEREERLVTLNLRGTAGSGKGREVMGSSGVPDTNPEKSA